MALRPSELAALFPGEVLVSASASNVQRGALYVLDASSTSQTPLLHWKGATHVAPHGLACVPSTAHADYDGGVSGLVVAIEADKAVLIVYSWQKDQPIQRIVLPHKMTCVALAPSGAAVATGAEDGRLYMWDVPSGALLCSFEAHYRAVRTLQFAPDSAALASGAEDGRVCVWSVPGLFERTDLTGGGVPSAYATFADHTLPITDVHWASGRFPESAALWTASEDGSVKLWDLATRRLTSTFALPGAVACMALDPMERFFFASLQQEPLVCRVELYAQDPGAWRARGGRGAEGVVERLEEPFAHVRLPDRVTTLALSLAASHLAVGTQTGQVHLIDVATLQTVRVLHASASLSAAPNTPVTNLVAMPRPPDLLAAAQLGKRGGKSDTEAASSTHVAPLPTRAVAPQFARALAPPSATPPLLLRLGTASGWAAADVDAYVGHMGLPSAARTPHTPHHATAETAAPVPTTSAAPPTSGADPTAHARIQQLEEELRRARSLNDEMWQHLVQTHVGAHR